MEKYNVIVEKYGKDGSTAACFELESNGRRFTIDNCHLVADPFGADYRLNCYWGSYIYEEGNMVSYCMAYLFLDEESKNGVLFLQK